MTKLLFSIPRDKILNSNSMPSQWYLKSQRASFLRNEGRRIGVDSHSSPGFSQLCVQLAQFNDTVTQQKSTVTKSLKKQKKSTKEINEALANIPDVETLDDRGVVPEFMYKKFVIDVNVFPPTRRKIDPANLYPTVKPIIDGLTDAGWWEDDNYKHLVKISFSYGGISSTAPNFEIELKIMEVENNGRD